MQAQGQTHGVAARVILYVALSGAALAYTWPAQAEVPFAPTRAVASKCRKLAYQAYPYQQPGHTQGSGARYALFKDCIDKAGFVDDGTVLPASRTTAQQPPGPADPPK